MSRAVTYNAIVLAVHSSGEDNREAFFFTKEAGLIQATLFGGPKSKLRAYVSLFHRGILWIYHDPVKNTNKITDFDVQSWRPLVRESYQRIMAATYVAEVTLASRGGGAPWDQPFTVLDETLEAIGTVPEEDISLITLRWVWQWLHILGVAPDITQCHQCACVPDDNDVLWYSSREPQIVCSQCAAAAVHQLNQPLIPLNGGARHWLQRILTVDIKSTGRWQMDSETRNQVQRLCGTMLDTVLEKHLPWYWEHR